MQEGKRREKENSLSGLHPDWILHLMIHFPLKEPSFCIPAFLHVLAFSRSDDDTSYLSKGVTPTKTLQDFFDYCVQVCTCPVTLFLTIRLIGLPK